MTAGLWVARQWAERGRSPWVSGFACIVWPGVDYWGLMIFLSASLNSPPMILSAIERASFSFS